MFTIDAGPMTFRSVVTRSVPRLCDGSYGPRAPPSAGCAVHAGLAEVVGEPVDVREGNAGDRDQPRTASVGGQAPAAHDLLRGLDEPYRQPPRMSVWLPAQFLEA